MSDPNPQSKPEYREAEPSSEDTSSDEEGFTPLNVPLPASRPESLVSVPTSSKTNKSQGNKAQPSRIERRPTKTKESIGEKLKRTFEKKPELVPQSSSTKYEYNHSFPKRSDKEMPEQRAKVPDSYDGGARDLDRFITQCRAFFLLEGGEYKEAHRQVLFAGMLLKGRPSAWFTPHMENYLNKTQDPETLRLFNSFNHFKQELERLYGILDKANAHMRQLERLQQTGSAAQYTAEFRRLSMGTGFNEPALRRCYYKGLKHGIKEEMLRGDEPANLAETIDRAHEIDAKFSGLRYENGRTDHRGPTNYKHQRKDTRTYDPMDLSATRGPLSKRDREHRIKNNLCLYCGKPGHRANACKAKGGKLAATHQNEEDETPTYYIKATYMEHFEETTENPEETDTDDDSDESEPCNIDNPCWTCQQSDEEQGWDDCDEPVASTENTDHHGQLSWTGCYDDGCLIHHSSKEASRWFPRKPGDKRRAPTPFPREGAPSPPGTSPSPNEEAEAIWDPEGVYVHPEEKKILVPYKTLIYFVKEGDQVMMASRQVEIEEYEDVIFNSQNDWINIVENDLIPQAKDKITETMSADK